jgi:hypothetical protein
MRRASVAIGLHGFVAAGLLAGFPPSVSGHHSFPAHYQADSSVRLEGTVSEFLWRNPHTFIHLEVVNEAGEPQIWAIEWNNTVIMANAGFTSETFHTGDDVIITGNPSRDGTRRVRLVTIERPADGLALSREGGIND